MEEILKRMIEHNRKVIMFNIELQCSVVEYKKIIENFSSRKITEILLSALPKTHAQQSVRLTTLQRGLVALSILVNVVLLAVVLFTTGCR